LGVTAPCREGTVASPTSLGFERGTIGAADESDDPVLRALDRATQLEGRVSVDGCERVAAIEAHVGLGDAGEGVSADD
jgi:hypothetical protein